MHVTEKNITEVLSGLHIGNIAALKNRPILLVKAKYSRYLITEYPVVN